MRKVIFFSVIFFPLFICAGECKHDECCDGKICEIFPWAQEVSRRHCGNKCENHKLLSECPEDIVRLEDLMCFIGRFHRDDLGPLRQRKRCYRQTINNGARCGLPICKQTENSYIYFRKCEGGKCDDDEEEVVEYCHRNCLISSCEMNEGVGRCIYTGFKDCGDGKYCDIDDGNELCRTFPTRRCNDSGDCPSLGYCFFKECQDNKCEYTERDCFASEYCDNILGKCVSVFFEEDKQEAVSDLKICRIESELDFTEYKDYIFFESVPGLADGYFEIYAAKSTHDNGDWMFVRKEQRNGDGYVYSVIVDPIESNLPFHPDAYKINFLAEGGDYSLDSIGMVNKRGLCE